MKIETAKLSNDTIQKFNSIKFKKNIFGLLRGEIVLPSAHVISIIVHNFDKDEITGEELHLHNLENVLFELTVLLNDKVIFFKAFESDRDYLYGNWEGISIVKLIDKLQIILDTI